MHDGVTAPWLLGLVLFLLSCAGAGILSVGIMAALRSGSHRPAIAALVLLYILLAPLILPPRAFTFSLIGVSYPFGVLGIIAYAILARPVEILASGYRNDGHRILRRLTVHRSGRREGQPLPWWVVAGAVGFVAAIQIYLFVL